MVHFVRPLEDGVELRSRFWYGFSVIDGKPVRKKMSEGFQYNEDRLKNSLIHTINEFANLATLLPEIYKEYKDTF